MPQPYPSLGKSYKRAYPFRLGTTSFIYPDYIVPNVKALAPYLDEIELLFFESKSKESFPSPSEIDTLVRLASDFDLTYNIHLPTDISLGHADEARRREAVEIVGRFMDLTAALSPTTWTLHLDWEERLDQAEEVLFWQERLRQSLSRLMAAGIRGASLSIETLMYPFEWVAPIITEFNLAVCIDLGHLILMGVDTRAVFDQYAHQTPIMHLHGVKGGRDHLSLDQLPDAAMDQVMGILEHYSGTVSLEVFSYPALQSSLKFLADRWQKRP